MASLCPFEAQLKGSTKHETQCTVHSVQVTSGNPIFISMSSLPLLAIFDKSFYVLILFPPSPPLDNPIAVVYLCSPSSHQQFTVILTPPSIWIYTNTYTLHISHYTMYTSHCTLHIAPYTLNTAQSTLQTVHCPSTTPGRLRLDPWLVEDLWKTRPSGNEQAI